MNSLQINLFANISAEGEHRRQINNLYNVKKVIITVSWTAPNSTNLSCLKASITVDIIYSGQRPGQRLQTLHLKVSCDQRSLSILKWRKTAEQDTIRASSNMTAAAFRYLTSSHILKVVVIRMRLAAKSLLFQPSDTNLQAKTKMG